MDLLISRRKVININFNPRYFIFDPFYFKFIYFGICISFKLTIFFFFFLYFLEIEVVEQNCRK